MGKLKEIKTNNFITKCSNNFITKCSSNKNVILNKTDYNDININHKIHGDLTIDCIIAGDININHKIYGDLTIDCINAGDININDDIKGKVFIKGGKVGNINISTNKIDEIGITINTINKNIYINTKCYYINIDVVHLGLKETRYNYSVDEKPMTGDIDIFGKIDYEVNITTHKSAGSININADVKELIKITQADISYNNSTAINTKKIKAIVISGNSKSIKINSKADYINIFGEVDGIINIKGKNKDIYVH